VRNLRFTLKSSRLILGLIILLTTFSVNLVQANDPNRVGLIVTHGDGEVITQCLEFSEQQITGYDVLERSGLDLNADVTNGMGAAICRLDNEGCTYPADECFCQCQGAPCTFWIYWYLDGGNWKFSSQGAANRQVQDGDVEAWVWGEGSPNNGGTQPPKITFDEICLPLVTDTPVPTHTSLPTATATPEPTLTSEPTGTLTPTPVSPPTIHHFQADRLAVDAGESVELHWDLSDAKAVYLRSGGNEEGIVAPGSKTVAPDQTTVYTLVAYNDGGESTAEVTITVNNTTPPTVPLTPTPPSGVTADTSLPEPIINFWMNSSTLLPGACTLLNWEVENANLVYLDGVEVDARASEQVCPQPAQIYTLRVVHLGGEQIVRIEVVVVTPTAVVDDVITSKFAITTTPVLAISATPEATLVSRNVPPALQVRPYQQNLAAETQATQGWSIWARLGIWGTLVGGWCAIGLVAIVVFAGVWWFNNRSGNA